MTEIYNTQHCLIPLSLFFPLKVHFTTFVPKWINTWSGVGNAIRPDSQHVNYHCDRCTVSQNVFDIKTMLVTVSYNSQVSPKKVVYKVLRRITLNCLVKRLMPQKTETPSSSCVLLKCQKVH